MLPDLFSFAFKGILCRADEGGQLCIILQQVREHGIISIFPCFVGCFAKPVQSQFPLLCWLGGHSKSMSCAMSLVPGENCLLSGGLGNSVVSGLKTAEGLEPLGEVRA